MPVLFGLSLSMPIVVSSTLFFLKVVATFGILCCIILLILRASNITVILMTPTWIFLAQFSYYRLYSIYLLDITTWNFIVIVNSHVLHRSHPPYITFSSLRGTYPSESHHTLHYSSPKPERCL